MPEPHYRDDLVTLFAGDCLEVMRSMPDASVDAVVTDPPAGISFMGKSWDADRGGRLRWVEWLTERMTEAARVLKPGGHALVWSLPRTSHWTAWALEDAGLQIRDCIMHIYGSGFPKSLDVSKVIDRAAYALPLWDEIRAHIRAWRDRAGMTNSELNGALGLATNGGGMAQHWTSDIGGQHSIPSKAMWLRLKDLLGWPDCPLDAVYAAVKDGAERPVLEVRSSVDRRGDGSVIGLGHAGTADITAPATPAAAQWSGWGTALKPSQEMWWLCRKPLSGTVASNVLAYGTGGLNIDACRVGHASTADLAQSQAKNPGRSDLATSDVYGAGRPQQAVNVAGRWPPNILLTHSASCRPAGSRPVKGDSRAGQAPGSRAPGFGDVGSPNGGSRPNGSLHGDAEVTVWECAPDCPVAEMDRQSGVLTSGDVAGSRRHTNGGNGVTHGQMAGAVGRSFADTGGASRFFPQFAWEEADFFPFRYQAKAPTKERPRLDDGTAWATVKPLALMRWLVRLVTPPGGTVLDPFSGTGTTGEACRLEGFHCVLIDSDPDALALTVKRLSRPVQARLGA